jgi:hypothetical protein
MPRPISRRQAIKTIGAADAGAPARRVVFEGKPIDVHL